MAAVDVCYSEGLQAPPQLAQSAMVRDTGIPEGRSMAAHKAEDAKAAETEGD